MSYMSQFVLSASDESGLTSIPNIFLDYHMPRANGEYVKVYLYLLRARSMPSLSLSVSGLADALDRTESDILRALKYWEKEGILSLECDEKNTLKGIYLCALSSPIKKTAAAKAAAPAKVTAPAPATKLPAQKTYSTQELSSFAEHTEIKQLLFVCSQYMGKTLSPSETELLLYFYDQLNFSADLLEYLVEYCVCKGSKSIHYIRKVGLAWAEAGITTVAQAKERSNLYRKHSFAIMKAFGINDRSPVASELSYIDKWLDGYAFPPQLVLEACGRTMERLHKPSFEYADRILTEWKKKGVQSMEDVRTLDESFESGKRKKASTPTPKPKSTGFSNFQQRDYDFDELETQLLKSQA